MCARAKTLEKREEGPQVGKGHASMRKSAKTTTKQAIKGTTTINTYTPSLLPYYARANTPSPPCFAFALRRQDLARKASTTTLHRRQRHLKNTHSPQGEYAGHEYAIFMSTGRAGCCFTSLFRLVHLRAEIKHFSHPHLHTHSPSSSTPQHQHSNDGARRRRQGTFGPRSCLR